MVDNGEKKRLMGISSLFPEPDTTGPNKGTAVTWRWFFPVLILAFGLRILVAQWADIPLHPDETFQYLEQAHRLVYDYGVIPWEYVFGIRSWFIPLCLAGILWMGQGLGLDEPWLYIPFVKVVLCLISLTLPVGMYRLTQVVWNERAAILAFLLGCFWHHFVYTAHKPMPGVLAAYGLVWLILWMVQPRSRARLFGFGFLMGLIFMLRYQLVPVLGLLWLVSLYRLRKAAGPILLGNVVALCLAGVLDQIFWGGFLSSYIDNFRLNFSYDVASTFGRTELLFYVKKMGVDTGGLVLVGMVGMILLWPRLWPVIGALIVGVLAFHIPAHKEFRFVLWVMPFVLIAVAVAGAAFYDRGRVVGRFAPALLCIWAGAVSLAYLSLYSGIFPGKPYKLREHSIRELTQALSRIETVTGVEYNALSLAWHTTPGYYALGHPVPLYFADWPALSPQKRAAIRIDHISHIVTEGNDAAPSGYDRIGGYGLYTLWASGSSRQNPGLTGFDLRTNYPESIPDDFITIGPRTPWRVEGW